jgi:hypothetical protein
VAHHDEPLGAGIESTSGRVSVGGVAAGEGHGAGAVPSGGGRLLCPLSLRLRHRLLRGAAVRVLGLGLYAIDTSHRLARLPSRDRAVRPGRHANRRRPTVARYQVVSTLFGHHPLDQCWGNLRVLWDILVRQDDGHIWNAVAGFGILYPFAMGLALVGLIADIARLSPKRRFEPRVLMLLWLVTALALAAVERGNINRLNLLWLPFIYFAAVGMRTVSRNRTLAVGLVAVHLALFVTFARDYFGPYRNRTAGVFHPSYGAAIRTATKAVSGKICVTNLPTNSYAYVGFYDRTDPREFARTVVYQHDGNEFLEVESFGRFTFGTERCPDDTEAWILNNDEIGRFRDRAARIETFSIYSVVIAAR